MCELTAVGKDAKNVFQCLIGIAKGWEEGEEKENVKDEGRTKRKN